VGRSRTRWSTVDEQSSMIGLHTRLRNRTLNFIGSVGEEKATITSCFLQHSLRARTGLWTITLNIRSQ